MRYIHYGSCNEPGCGKKYRKHRRRKIEDLGRCYVHRISSGFERCRYCSGMVDEYPRRKDNPLICYYCEMRSRNKRK
jgi:hypothetical protein